MTQVTLKTLQRYIKSIPFTDERKLPFSQGTVIHTLIQEFQIPAIKWGYEGSLIGIETKKQFLIWRDVGSHLEFKGLMNKEA